LLCVPLILAEGAAGSGRVLQLLVLPLLCVLFIQATLAWTPEQARWLSAGGGRGVARCWVEVFALALALVVLRMLTDVWLRRVLVLPEIDDWQALARMLPFTGLVQPLFLVLGVYAFALRLGRRSRLAQVAVVLVHQTIVLLQFGSLANSGVQAVLVLVAGAQGLLLGGSYLRYGIAAPVTLCLAVSARHALCLLYPVLRGAAAA
jgi:isoprenylcysteine carboxyl methyltransferase (ICMT) family protein YpbQ